MLSVEHVHKSYGALVALEDVTFDALPGQVVALVGRNGAGKTTLMSIVAGLRRADRGRVRVAGIDPAVNPAGVHELLGMAPQDTAVYPTLTCRQNLQFFARLAGRGRREVTDVIDELAHALGLDDLIDRKVQYLSGGERRRLHTAIALVGRPALVLLDEPTVGADVQTRVDLIAFVRNLASSGTTVVYSTHYLGEVAEFDASVVILHHGRKAAHGTVADIIARHAVGSIEVTFEGPVPDLPRLPGEIRRQVHDGRLRIESRSTSDIAATLLTGLGARLHDLREFTVNHPDLEAAFLSVTRSDGESGDTTAEAEVANVG
jgi:ABC-2 type transport system ATP-binding protein